LWKGDIEPIKARGRQKKGQAGGNYPNQEGVGGRVRKGKKNRSKIGGPGVVVQARGTLDATIQKKDGEKADEHARTRMGQAQPSSPKGSLTSAKRIYSEEVGKSQTSNRPPEPRLF